jgi:hypothetical protein
MKNKYKAEIGKLKKKKKNDFENRKTLKKK